MFQVNSLYNIVLAVLQITLRITELGLERTPGGHLVQVPAQSKPNFEHRSGCSGQTVTVSEEDSLSVHTVITPLL